MLRVLVTGGLAAFGIYGFWDGAVTGDHITNPFGIMFLLLAALFWFGWKTIAGAFRSVKDESDIPILRLGSATIKGMRGGEHENRRSPS